MSQNLRTFFRRPFVRNVFTAASGAVGAQAVTMAFAPLITRLYGPEAYGIQGVYMALAGVLSAVAGLTYPLAIVLPRNDAYAWALARLSICIGSVTSLLVAVVLAFFGKDILVFLNVDEIGGFAYIIPLYMFFSVWMGVCGQLLIRLRAFSLTARIAILQAFVIGVIKTSLGMATPTAAVLVATNALGSFLHAGFMLIGLRRIMAGASDRDHTPAGSVIRTLAVSYRDFPLLRAPQVLMSTVSQSLPVILLASFFGPVAVGHFNIGLATLALPAGLVSNSMMQVFYPRIVDAIHSGEDARRLLVSATAGLALIAILPFSFIIATGPELFAYVFGSEWRKAGAYGQWLSIWIFLQCINKPSVAAIPALGLQKGLLMYELLSTGLSACALYIGLVLVQSDLAAVAAFSIAGASSYLLLIAWVISSVPRGSELSRTKRE